MRSQLESNLSSPSSTASESTTLLATDASAPDLSASIVYDGGEELIPDVRSEIRPAQMVEDKLMGMLKGDFVMVSQLRMKRMIARRS